MSNETTNPVLMFEDSGGGRGLIIARFSDINGDACSIQTSSLATDDALWLGQQRCTRCQAPTRMHLNRALAAVLAKALNHFVATGTLPSAGTRLTACARRKESERDAEHGALPEGDGVEVCPSEALLPWDEDDQALADGRSVETQHRTNEAEPKR